MKSIRTSMLFKVVILAIGALVASASPAQAQSASGKFTLTHEARWCNVLLSPGAYSFSLQSASLPAAIMVGKTGAAQIGIVLPAEVSMEKLSSGSTLVLSRSPSGESYVSALYLGEFGLSLHYPAPRSQAAAAESAKLAPIAGSQPAR
ncbi:MAG: hypothetical protein ACRD20_01535 [Terriglobales bacterium]